MTRILELYIGLPGSGKTDHARRVVAAAPPGEWWRVNRDDLRAMVQDGWTGNKAVEKVVTGIQRAAIVAAWEAGVSRVIVDDTNIKVAHREELAALARYHDAHYREVLFTGVPLETCLKRNAARLDKAPVLEEWIRRAHDELVAQGLALPQ